MSSMTALLVDQEAFELIDGDESIGGRRFLTADDLDTLHDLANRYAEAVRLHRTDERGELDEALPIRTEQQLPVYEPLGDVRSVAVTWGQIGDIYFQRGELDEALDFAERRLEVHREMGDIDSIAHAQWQLAQIALQRGDYETAAPALIEAFQLFDRLGRPDGVAVVGGTLGQLLLAAGNHDEATTVINSAAQAYRKLGMSDRANQLEELLDNPPDR